MVFPWSRRKRLYLDYASATPVAPEALAAQAAAAALVGNPGAIHAEGVAASASLESSRTRLAHELGCKARELMFVSGGTEANNLAILGHFKHLVLGGKNPQSTHWVVSAIEHPSVLACFDHVEFLGGTVTRIVPDSRGLIAPETVGRALRPETVFVSVGAANGEIGVVQPLARIAQVIRAHEATQRSVVLFHSDAGQFPLYRIPRVHTLGVDLFSLDSAKLYGPRGIGALYLSNRAALAPILHGGGQERGLRAGTESVALAAGFGEAFTLASRRRDRDAAAALVLRDGLARWFSEHVPGGVINGSLAHALPHLLNVSIPEVGSEYLVLALDKAGIAVSTKSACREGESLESHVVSALCGRPEDAWRAGHTLRISLGRGTSTRDIRHVMRTLQAILASHAS